MSGNEYYKENFFKRTWRGVGDFFKKIPTRKFDAVAGAIGFFIVLVGMLEYKVFESMYGMTGDLILTASTLLVTAFGGVYAEVVLRRNEKATDDQNLLADWIFGISLLTSAFVGLGAWAQAAEIDSVNVGFGIILSIPEFRQMSFLIITAVTVADILILRAYFRGDVDAQYRRDTERANSDRRDADLKVEKKLLDFDTQVKTKTEQLLRVESRRREVRGELERLYGGRVPTEIMTQAMQELDLIMREIKTGEDINKDGAIGFAPAQPMTRQFAQEVPTLEIVPTDQKADVGFQTPRE